MPPGTKSPGLKSHRTPHTTHDYVNLGLGRPQTGDWGICGLGRKWIGYSRENIKHV